MRRWSLMMLVFATAFLCGCGTRPARKAETEWEEADVRWEEEEEAAPAARARRVPLVVEEAEPEVEAEEEPVVAEEAGEEEAAEDEPEVEEEDIEAEDEGEL